jgi:AraC-like DNA-binding protein
VSYEPRLLFDRIILALQRNPRCSLEGLSRELRVSRRTIQNAVNAVTGKKLRDLREELLLARVKNLLVSTPNATIKKVALDVGYRSPRSFAHAVRRACGVSPKQLRNRIAGDLLSCRPSTIISAAHR